MTDRLCMSDDKERQILKGSCVETGNKEDGEIETIRYNRLDLMESDTAKFMLIERDVWENSRVQIFEGK